MARRLSLAAGLLAIALALAVALTQSGERRSGSDWTPNGAFAFDLESGQQACQGGELTPADTAALRMTLGTYGAPGQRLSVSIVGPAGNPVTAGGLGPGWRQGVVRIPVRAVEQASAEDTFCVRNEGAGPIAVAGDKPDPGFQLTLAGRRLAEVRMRVDYMRPGNETWLSLAPVIAHRFSFGKAGWFGSWAWAVYLVLVLGAIAVAAAVLLEPERRR